MSDTMSLDLRRSSICTDCHRPKGRGTKLPAMPAAHSSGTASQEFSPSSSGAAVHILSFLMWKGKAAAPVEHANTRGPDQRAWGSEPTAHSGTRTGCLLEDNTPAAPTGSACCSQAEQNAPVPVGSHRGDRDSEVLTPRAMPMGWESCSDNPQDTPIPGFNY